MKPPKSLSAAARAWWGQLQREYNVTDSAGLLLLQAAMQAHDRAAQCSAAIKRDGDQVADRFGQMKPHPLLAAERDARAQMLGALKALNFDVEPKQAGPGRPPDSFGWKGGK